MWQKLLQTIMIKNTTKDYNNTHYCKNTENNIDIKLYLQYY